MASASAAISTRGPRMAAVATRSGSWVSVPATRKVAVPIRAVSPRMQTEAVEDDLFGEQPVFSVLPAERVGEGLGGLGRGVADQRPFRVDGFQLDQLPLAGRGDQHGPHLADVGGRGTTGLQPVAQLVRQRLRAAIDLQVAAEQRAAVGRRGRHRPPPAACRPRRSPRRRAPGRAGRSRGRGRRRGVPAARWSGQGSWRRVLGRSVLFCRGRCVLRISGARCRRDERWCGPVQWHGPLRGPIQCQEAWTPRRQRNGREGWAATYSCVFAFRRLTSGRLV